MSFELLDSLLEQSGSGVSSVKVNKESEVYADLDNLIEEAMRESLRFTITETNIPSKQKVNQLMIVENAVFTKPQMSRFMMETIHPILALSGNLSETFNFGGENPIDVPLPVYETALCLYLAKEGVLEEDDEALGGIEPDEDRLGVISPEDEEEDEYEEEERPMGTTNEGYLFEDDDILDEDEEEEGDVEIGGENSPVVVVNTSEGRVKIPGFVVEHINEICLRYDIDEVDTRDEIIESAIGVLGAVGIRNLRPSIFDATDYILEYNLIAEAKGIATAGDLLKEEDVYDAGYFRTKKRWLEDQARKKEALANRKIAELKAAGKPVGKIRAKVAQAWASLKNRLAKMKSKLKEKLSGFSQTARNKAHQLNLRLKNLKGRVGGSLSKAGTRIKGAAWSTPARKGITTAIGAAAAATAAALAYRKWKSRACAGLTGDAYTRCKAKAADHAISSAKSQLAGCAHAANPAKCKDSIHKQIEKWHHRKSSLTS